MDITPFLVEIVEREGGYVDHPQDRGGPTKYGITLFTLTKWRDAPVTAADVQALTKEEALEIYKTLVWQEEFDTFPPAVLRQVVDIAAHSGRGTAVQLLQRSVNALGYGPLRCDGVFGPKTLAGVRNTLQVWGGRIFGDALADERVRYLSSLVAARPAQLVFLNGWVSRALSFKSYVVSHADAN